MGINLYKKAPFVRWSKRVGRKDMPQKQKKTAGTSGLPVIKCDCGAEILLVPNVKKMNEAIEAHVLEHTKKCKNIKEAEAEGERVRSLLITEVLDKASEM